MLKKLAMAALILTPIFFAAHAGNAAPKGNWNAITLYNNTGHDISYVFVTTFGGVVYGIKKDNVDIYHSGFSDEYTTIQVGNCSQMSGNGGGCQGNSDLQNCVDGQHYNANLIKSVVITSNTSCRVTCLDGGTTSCKQTG